MKQPKQPQEPQREHPSAPRQPEWQQEKGGQRPVRPNVTPDKPRK